MLGGGLGGMLGGGGQQEDFDNSYDEANGFIKQKVKEEKETQEKKEIGDK